MTDDKSVDKSADKSVTILPDGSAFMIGSLPLPKDHWVYQENSEPNPAIADSFRCIPNAREMIVDAARFAIRGATMSGKEADFDPDALVLNLLYALLGPFSQSIPVVADGGDMPNILGITSPGDENA